MQPAPATRVAILPRKGRHQRDRGRDPRSQRWPPMRSASEDIRPARRSRSAGANQSASSCGSELRAALTTINAEDSASIPALRGQHLAIHQPAPDSVQPGITAICLLPCRRAPLQPRAMFPCRRPRTTAPKSAIHRGARDRDSGPVRATTFPLPRPGAAVHCCCGSSDRDASTGLPSIRAGSSPWAACGLRRCQQQPIAHCDQGLVARAEFARELRPAAPPSNPRRVAAVPQGCRCTLAIPATRCTGSAMHTGLPGAIDSAAAGGNHARAQAAASAGAPRSAASPARQSCCRAAGLAQVQQFAQCRQRGSRACASSPVSAGSRYRSETASRRCMRLS